MSEQLYDYGDMIDQGRTTFYADICPVCEQLNDEPFATECRYCGWPMGKDWETIEVDQETDVILRTVISPQTATPAPHAQEQETL